MRRAVFLCLAALAVTARAEQPPSLPRTIAIRPAKPPTPALGVRLLPSRAEQIPGDAAVFYHRAIESLIEVRYREEIEARKAGTVAEGADSPDASTAAWLRLPADQFPREELRKLLGNRRRALEEARLGSLRETCDWGFRYRDEGFDLLLPDIQEMRWLARWLALNARLDAEEGRIDQALTGVKTGFGVARDVGRGEILIQLLVAATCAGYTLDAVEALIQQPGCPNLYWAMAAIPRPLIDMTAAFEGEATMLERQLPALKTIDGPAWSPEAARKFGDDLARELGFVDDWPKSQGSMSRPAIGDLPAHAALLGSIARDYRACRQALLDAGFPAERIDAMPMIQVVGLESYRTYRARYDEEAKWAYLPYPLAAKRWGEAATAVSKPAPGLPFYSLIPATRAAHTSNLRLERRLAVLMTVEAVRLYAASHDGALPASLDDLTDAPAPSDPVTGRPFDYKFEGGRAVLSSPPPVGWERIPDAALRYELVLAR